MATLQLDIPPSFISSMQQLMQTMQQMQRITTQFIQSQQQINVPIQQAHAAQTQVMSRMNKMLQLFRRIQAAFASNISSIMNAMGTIAQTFLRGLALSAADILGPITIAVGAAFSIAQYTSRFARWIWNKMVDLGDSMLQDWLLSSGMMATVGGVRSYRTAFGMLPDQQIIAQMPKARGYAASQQAIALGLLGVKNFRNSADMMVQATLAAARFMKQQQKGQELKMAEAMALTSLFSPRDLLALREMNEKELEERAKLYEANKEKLEMSEGARHGWMNFSIQVKIMWARIQTAIAEGMADPRSNFMQAFDQLSKSMVKFVKVFMDSPIVEKVFNWLANQIDAFANKLSDNETISDFKKVANTIGEIIKLIYQATTILLGFGASLGLREKPGLLSRKYPGRAHFMERIGMRGEPRGPFGIIPGAKYQRPSYAPAEVMPAPITRYPGRAGFTKRIGIARPKGAPEISPRAARTGRPYEEPRLRVPKTPEEAPETVEAATKGGFVRGSGEIDRSQFVKEMQDKPWLRQRAMEIAANEEGTNPQGTQMIVESAMNRAQVRGTSLEKELRWTSEGGYYDDARGHDKAVATAASPQGQKILGRSVDNALGGSNTSDYATDNASGPLADRQAQSGRFKAIKKTPQGDTMFSPGSAEPGLVPRYDAWRQKQQARQGKGGVGGFTAKDIQEMDGPTAQQPSTQPAAGATSPDAVKAVGGKDPEAFIVHHTGGGGTAEGVQNTLRQRGLGVQYVMERDGTIKQIGGPGSANIMPESRYRQSPILGKDRPFLENSNIVGMEVIAKNDKDVTPAQIAAARKFIAEKYPNTPVFGHGEVNPGHKEADEGMTITNAIRNDRANPASASADTRKAAITIRPGQNTIPGSTAPYSESTFQPAQKAPFQGAPANPADDVKVDNRSDMDIHQAKTHSDNDTGEPMDDDSTKKNDDSSGQSIEDSTPDDI